MNKQDIETMIKLARDKQRLIQDFLDLTEQQGEAILAHNYEPIPALIEKKQYIIEQVNILDINRSQYKPNGNETLNLINQQTKQLTNQALEINTKNILALKYNQMQIFEKLKTAKKNTKAHYLYLGISQDSRSTFIDQEK